MSCKQTAGLKRRSSQIDSSKGKASARKQERATCEHEFKRFLKIQGILLNELFSIAPKAHPPDNQGR